MVRPRKQRALAAALGAEIRELAGDHGAPWEEPRQFSSLTVELVNGVVERSAAASVDTSLGQVLPEPVPDSVRAASIDNSAT